MMDISYLPDTQVDDALDTELRTLLTRCFGDVFKDKRHYYELPAHRWLVRDEGELIAHLAVHDKTFEHEGTNIPFLGIAEVCVAPSHRGRGLVRAMLQAAETQFSTVPFAILLGDPGVYSSSGYHMVDTIYFPDRDAENPNPDTMVKALGAAAWPSGKVVIEGPPF
jgi:predicted N-acetyltransferase YhbS